jgi:hypothetical protein
MNYLSTLLIGLCIATLSFGQVAGDTDNITHSMNFSKQFTDVELDPSPMVGDDARREIRKEWQPGSTINLSQLAAELGVSLVFALFEEAGVSIPGAVSDIIDVIISAGSPINPVITPRPSFEYGVYYEVNSIGNAEIDIDYPVEVQIIYPEPNTFGCGDDFTIETSCEIINPNMDIEPPFFNQEIGPILDNFMINISLGISIGLCQVLGLVPTSVNCDENETGDGCAEVAGVPTGVVVCESVVGEIWSFNLNDELGIDNFLPPLITFCEDAFEPGANTATLLGCGLPGEAEPFLFVFQEALDAYNQSQFPPTNYDIATFDTDLVIVAPPAIPSAAGITIPEFDGEFRRIRDSDLTFSSLEDGRKLKVSGIKEDLTNMSFDAVSLLDYFKIPGTNVGIMTSFELGGGLFNVDIGDIAPTFTADANMNFEFEPVVYMELDLGVPMAYEVVDDILGVVGSGNGQIVELIAGQRIEATYPEALSDPTVVSNEYSMDGDFTTLTKQDYYTEFEINLLQLKINNGETMTVYNTVVGEESDGTDILQDHTLKLDGFPSYIKEPFTLDPEYPIVNVDYLGIEDVLNLGGGERAVVYKAVFSNGGDVRLNDMQLELDLSTTFATAQSWSVSCTASDQVDLNGLYDGGNDINLLGSNVSLDVGESATVEILVKVKPEISPIDGNGCFGTVDYQASTIAYGTSPIGTEVESNIYHCTDERTGENIIATVDLGAAVIDELSDYTVYAWEELRFDKPLERSLGNAGSSDRIIFENVSIQGGDEYVIVGDIHSGNTIDVLGESHIVADYLQVEHEIDIHNEQKSSIEVFGAISSASSCASVFPVPMFMYPVWTSRERVNVDNNQTVILEPGDYRDVIVRNNATVIMSSGVYNIGRWVFLGNNSNVEYELDGGPITINLDRWQALNRKNLSFAISGEGETEDITYIYAGNQPTIFTSSLVQGTIFAPFAEIEFDRGSELQGACYARKVNFRSDSRFIGHRYLDELNIDPDCQGILEAPLRQEAESAAVQAAKFSSETAIYPNPFADWITLDFHLPNAAEVELAIVDMSGKYVYRQSANQLDAGYHTINVDQASTLRQGMYVIHLRINDEIITSKMVKLSR